MPVRVAAAPLEAPRRGRLVNDRERCPTPPDPAGCRGRRRPDHPAMPVAAASWRVVQRRPPRGCRCGRAVSAAGSSSSRRWVGQLLLPAWPCGTGEQAARRSRSTVAGPLAAGDSAVRRRLIHCVVASPRGPVPQGASMQRTPTTRADSAPPGTLGRWRRRSTHTAAAPRTRMRQGRAALASGASLPQRRRHRSAAARLRRSGCRALAGRMHRPTTPAGAPRRVWVEVLDRPGPGWWSVRPQATKPLAPSTAGSGGAVAPKRPGGTRPDGRRQPAGRGAGRQRRRATAPTACSWPDSPLPCQRGAARERTT
jgi:hypothetical protein